MRCVFACFCLLLIPALTCADELVPEHGKYSAAYQSDWAIMPDGRELARHDLVDVTFEDVKGEEARRTFIGEEEVTLSGERLRVTWESPECDKYKHTLYFFQKCERVVIEDMWIIQNHADWRPSSTFFFESCGTVEIRNCYVQGSWGRAAIRVEGCREYFIDGVELCGIATDEGFRCGPGIFVNNGAGLGEDGRQRYIHAPDPYDLEWGVIQNCWFHDYEPTPEFMNHDGILFHAPADGIVFNCYFENWDADSAIDDSHRRNDAGYQNHLHRIERCIFERCHRIKTNGASGSPSCALLWCNNLYLDSSLTDYHFGWPNWRLHESYVFSEKRPGYFHVMNCREGKALLRNCLMSCPVKMHYMYETMGKPENQDISMMDPDWLMYFIPGSAMWLHARGGVTEEFQTWEQWQAAGFDAHSTLTDADPGFVDPEAGDYRLRADSLAVGAGSPDTLVPDGIRPGITHDFFGRPRPNPPSCGAFEIAEE